MSQIIIDTYDDGGIKQVQFDRADTRLTVQDMLKAMLKAIQFVVTHELETADRATFEEWVHLMGTELSTLRARLTGEEK